MSVSTEEGFEGEDSANVTGNLRVDLTIDGTTTTVVSASGVSSQNYNFQVQGPYGKTGTLSFYWNDKYVNSKTVTFIPTAG